LLPAWNDRYILSSSHSIHFSYPICTCVLVRDARLIAMSDPVQTEKDLAPTKNNEITSEMSAEDVTGKNIDSGEEGDEPQPKLHAKTFLAVFAVCLIYFAQDFTLVGAGAVSLESTLNTTCESSPLVKPTYLLLCGK